MIEHHPCKTDTRLEYFSFCKTEVEALLAIATWWKTMIAENSVRSIQVIIFEYADDIEDEYFRVGVYWDDPTEEQIKELDEQMKVLEPYSNNPKVDSN